MAKHTRFISRTVMVLNNDIDSALEALKTIMSKEGIIRQVRRRNAGYEKPTQMRQRISYERCLRLYSAEMKRKIQMVSIKDRQNPFPR